MALVAKFGGTCARTGKSYPAGALIEKGAKGWYVVGGEAGIPAVPQMRWTRHADGTVRETDLSRPYFCACAKKIPGGTMDRAVMEARTLARETRDGAEVLACPVCGAVRLTLLTPAQVWSEAILPHLYLTADLSLSRKVGADKWALVSAFFEYTSFRDLADHYDEMDEFDRAAEYENLRGGDWFLRDRKHIPAVEEALGILPDNRFAVKMDRERQAAQEAAEEQRAEAARLRSLRADRDRLFPRAEATAPPPSEPASLSGPAFTEFLARDLGDTGFTIYGGGSKWVAEQGDDGAIRAFWHLVNNGMDGDDWSRNNIGTGGAGAVGCSWPATPERVALLAPYLPGPLRTSLETVRAALVVDAAKRPYLRAAEWKAGTMVNSSHANNFYRTGALVAGVALDEDLMLYRDLDDGTLFLYFQRAENLIRHLLSTDEYECDLSEYTAWAKRVGIDWYRQTWCLSYPSPTSEQIALFEGVCPEWARSRAAAEAATGRFILTGGTDGYVADRGDSAIRIASCWFRPLNDRVTYLPGVTVTAYEPKNHVATWSDRKVTKRNFHGLLRDGYWYPHTLPGNAPALSPVAACLMKQAATKGSDADPAALATASEVAVAATLVDDEKNGANSGAWRRAERLLVTHSDGRTETLFRASVGHWYRGEDADVMETVTLHGTEEAARSAAADH